VLLENVKNLRSHDGGKTWAVILHTLEELGYEVFSEVIDAAGWVPQHRERVFIVGFLKKTFGERPPFTFPEGPTTGRPRMAEVLDPDPDPKYTLSEKLWNYLQEYARKHREKGNGFGFGLTSLDGTSRTLSARYFKDGSEILIPQACADCGLRHSGVQAVRQRCCASRGGGCCSRNCEGFAMAYRKSWQWMPAQDLELKSRGRDQCRRRPAKRQSIARFITGRRC
jgi:DNA-cytosine methyltransferase